MDFNSIHIIYIPVIAVFGWIFLGIITGYLKYSRVLKIKLPQHRKKKKKMKKKNTASSNKTEFKNNFNFQPMVFSRFSAALARHFDLGLNREQLICLYQECLEMACHNNDIYLKIQLIELSISEKIPFDGRLKELYLYLLKEGKNFEDIISYHKKCIDIAKETGNKHTEINEYFNQEMLNEELNQYYDAIVYGRICIDIAEETNDKQFAMTSYFMLGRTYHELNLYDEAIAHNKKCIDIAKEIDNKNIEMTACFIVGKLYFSLSKYEEAFLYSERSLQNAKATGDKRYEAIAYLLIQDCQHHLHQYDDAILTGQKCIAVTKETGDKDCKTSAFMILGNTYKSLNQHKDAIDCLIKTVDIAIESGDQFLEMRSHFELGKMYYSMNQLDIAVIHIKKSLDIAIETGSRSNESYSYMALGDSYLQLHQHANARDCLQKCIDIAKETGNKRAEADAYLLLGKTYDSLHQENNAILYFKKSLDIFKKIGMQEHEMDAYFLLGKVYKSSKQYNDAIDSFKKCIIIAWKIGNKQREKCLYFQIGNIYDCMNQYDKAICYGKKYMETAKEVGDEDDVMMAYLALGVAYLGLDQYDNTFFNLSEGLKIATEREDVHAIESFNEFLGRFYIRVGVHGKASREGTSSGMLWITDNREELTEESSTEVGEKNERGLFFEEYLHHRSNDDYEHAIVCLRKHVDAFELCPRYHSTDKVYCIIEIAQMHNMLHQYHKSLKCYQEGLVIAVSVDAKHLQAECYFQQGMVFFRLGRMKEAEDSSRESIRCFDIMFVDVGRHDDFKISLLDTYAHCYYNLVFVLIHTKQLEQALIVSDQSRARSLKDLINFGMKRETNERQDLQYSDVEFLVSNNKYSILFYSVCCKNAKKAYTFVIDCGEDIKFSIKCLKHCGQGIGFEKYIDRAFDELKVWNVKNCENRSLDAEQDEAKGSLHSEQDKMTPLTKKFQKTNLAEQCRCDSDANEASNSSGEEISMESALEELHQLLLHHDRMYTVKQDKPIAMSIKYCGKQDEIVIIPDGPLYKVPFAALRDPVTGRYLSETKRIRLAPSITTLKLINDRPADYHCTTGALIIGDPLVGKVMLDGEEKVVPPLESADAEARVVAYRLDVTPLIGKDATKPAVIEKLRQGVSVVHIAAHGSITKGTIVLAPSPEIRATKIPDEEDYMLTMADVQKAQVRAKLVVLSCCHSGRGEIKAEGVVGMCRAFLASGARAVVASLWAIDDDATLEFMSLFYFNLKTGKSAGRSLQLTMNEMRNTTNYNKPKYWAPFFLMGDDVTL